MSICQIMGRVVHRGGKHANMSFLHASRVAMLLRRMIYLVLALCLGVAHAQEAPPGGPQVLRIEPVLAETGLNINADVYLPVSDELRHYAERGVMLYFTADLEIVQPRRWWFDKDVVTVEQTWRVVYNALTRQWRIGTGDLSLPEASLDDALSLVRNIRGWEVLPGGKLDTNEEYQGRMRVRLDTSLLARPFRVDALNSSAWSLATPWKDFSFSISDAEPQR